jgi:hypothetical protein
MSRDTQLPKIKILAGLFITNLLLLSVIPANGYHRHSVTFVGGILDIDKRRYQIAMKHWQQQFVVPEFVKAAIGIKIVAILVNNVT